MLATLLQMFLAFTYNVWKHGALAATVLVVMFGLNISFFIIYRRKFERTFLPKEKQKLVNAGELTLEEANKRFLLPSDHDFFAYKKKHSCLVCFISIMTVVCSFQFNKMYYSQFYSLGNSTAKSSCGTPSCRSWWSIYYWSASLLLAYSTNSGERSCISPS